jgi:hypothetical protein
MVTGLHILAAFGLGLAGGMVGGLFGIGGGIVVIPLFGIFFAVDQQIAQGTALIMVVPNVIVAFWRYFQRVGIDLRMAAMLAGTSLITTYPVARFATRLDPGKLRLAFAGFLLGLAIVVGYRTWNGTLAAGLRRPLAWGWSAAVGVAGGIVSGLFGVGGAFVGPPLLTAFFGVRQFQAQGLGLAIVCPGATIALFTYAGAGQVDWLLGVPLAAGGTLAISAGVAAAQRLPERPLRFAFCALALTSAMLLATHT